ncbi:MAG TPA: hypothetical protein VFT22_30605 [Kofleriaceae bacterium]|nr:hypothetical protein [Kofleriaceae bacterium]
MKNARTPGKLKLNTETIAHLRRLALEELGAIRGGLPGHPRSEGGNICPSTACG